MERAKEKWQKIDYKWVKDGKQGKSPSKTKTGNSKEKE